MRPSRRRRLLVLLLLLPGLLLRAAIPSGFMPGTGGALGVTVVLCTAHGLQSVVMPSGDGAPSAPTAPSSHHEAPCAFAMTAVGAPPPPPSVAAVALMHSAVDTIAFRSFSAVRPDVRSQSPRGPPAAA